MSEDVTLDIGSLMDYTGQGKCEVLWCTDDTAARYRDQLRTWATSRNWAVTDEDEDCFVIRRI